MILYNILTACSLKRVLEIGCHYGASTTAFVEALANGSAMQVHLCDLKFQTSLLKIVDCYTKTNKIILHEMSSAALLKNAPHFDLALLDGSHISEDLEDEFELLSLNHTKTLILHDTNSQNLEENKDKPWFDGPLFISDRLKCSPDWLCLEDKEDRENELTRRGFLLATQDVAVYHYAKLAFDYWTQCDTDLQIKPMRNTDRKDESSRI